MNFDVKKDVKKKIIFPLILIVFSTLIALFIAEVTLRILNIGYGNAPLNSDPVFHHVHPADYRFISQVPTGEYGGHDIYYNKNRLVSNPDTTQVNKTNTDCRIAFLGDSFTEAGQVAYKDSFVGILDQSSNCIIKNYGVSSYSPVFYLLQWRIMVKSFNPTLVVVQLYSNDMSSDIKYMKIAKKDANGRVIAVPGPKANWLTTQLRKSYLMRFLRKVQLQLLWMYENKDKKQSVVAGMVEENPDITPLSADLIKTLAKEVTASGAQFLLTVIPSKFRIRNHITNNKTPNETPEFSDKWMVFSQNNNIPFMDLTRPFMKEAKNGTRLFFNNDIHFNENGHKIVATELRKELRKELSKKHTQLFNSNTAQPQP